MLTLEELTKRVQRDDELLDKLDQERDKLRQRLYRYRLMIKGMTDLEELANEDDS